MASVITAKATKVATYPFPREKAEQSFQFTINDIRDGSAYYKSPPHPHAHTYFEIFLMEKGGGIHMIDHTDYEIGDFSVHILQPGITHFIRRNEHTRGCVIVFALDVIAGDDNTITNALLCFFKNQLIHPVANVSKRAFKELMSIISLMQSDIAAAGDNSSRRAYVRSLFSAFLLTLKPHFTAAYHMDQAATLSLVNRFNDLVNTHYHEGLAISHYADKLNISEKTLTRIVKKHTALTPARMIKERIILEACRLLHTTDHSVKEIGYHLHFSDPAHFVKVFRQEKQCTPQEYRKGV